MVNKSVIEDDWVSGHALLATAPPRDHCEEHGMDVEYPHKMPDLPKPDLAKMLNLCARLPGLNEHGSNGELTPVMAWAFILTHPACPDMTQEDFEAIKDDLKPKVACYGFGAVLENFEVEDAIHKVLTVKNVRIPQVGMDMEWDMVSRYANRVA